MGIKHLLKDRGYGQLLPTKRSQLTTHTHPLFTNEIWNLNKFTMVKIRVHTFVLLLL